MRLVVKHPGQHGWGAVGHKSNREQAYEVKFLEELYPIAPFDRSLHFQLDRLVFSLEPLKFFTDLLQFFLATIAIRVQDH